MINPCRCQVAEGSNRNPARSPRKGDASGPPSTDTILGSRLTHVRRDAKGLQKLGIREQGGKFDESPTAGAAIATKLRQ
jgi:hypothetical protein